MKRNLLEDNPCPEDWERMKETGLGRHCEKCNHDLEDLTETPINEIIEKHVSANKCVRLSSSQIDVINFLRSKGKQTLTASLLMGASLINPAFSQTTDTTTAHKDFCVLKGQLVVKSRRIDLNKEPKAGNKVFIVINGQTFETKSDDKGYFSLKVPKNCEIEYSNIQQLTQKKIRNQRTINVRKVQESSIRQIGRFLEINKSSYETKPLRKQ